MHHVTFVLFPEFQLLAYVLATETLRVANKCAGRSVFSWETRSVLNTPVQASNGALIAPSTTEWPRAPEEDLILLFAGYHPLAHTPARLRAYLARASATQCVIGGVDTGTVILAELGLLNRRKAVLHHEAEAAFRQKWPDISISDQIYCLDRDRLTAAGGTATGDAILAWIAREVGPDLALATSEGMVHGQVRSSETPQRPSETADPILMHMHQLMATHIECPLSLTEICSNLDISVKQLRRRCVHSFGITPSTYYRNIRLNTAHHLLSNSEQTVSEIALACGFESLSSFSRAVRAQFGATPKQIQRRPSKAIAAYKAKAF